MNFLARLRDKLSAKPADKRTVSFDDEGFEISINHQQFIHVSWGSVQEVFAFKHDCFAYDEICLGFRCDGATGDEWVGEQDPEFEAFQKQVVRMFPGIRTDWFKEVAVPAFQENRTTLWSQTLTEK
jgi:hypothetical protein